MIAETLLILLVLAVIGASIGYIATEISGLREERDYWQNRCIRAETERDKFERGLEQFLKGHE